MELINAVYAIALGDRLQPETADALLAAWGFAVGTGNALDRGG